MAKTYQKADSPPVYDRTLYTEPGRLGRKVYCVRVITLNGPAIQKYHSEELFLAYLKNTTGKFKDTIVNDTLNEVGTASSIDELIQSSEEVKSDEDDTTSE